MKIYKFERYEFPTVVHEIGSVFEAYYIRGKGLITRMGFSNDQEEIDAVEAYLKNPLDRKKELSMKMKCGSLPDKTYLKLVAQSNIKGEIVDEFIDFDVAYSRIHKLRNKSLDSVVDVFRV